MLALAGVWGYVGGEVKGLIVYCFKVIQHLSIIRKFHKNSPELASQTFTTLRYVIAGLSILFLVIANQKLYAQNAIVGDGFSTGWGGVSCPTGNGNFTFLGASAGLTYIATLQPSGGTVGDKYWRYGVDWSLTTSQLTITNGTNVTVTPSTKYSLNTTCTTAGALKYTVPLGGGAWNYVFKTLDAGTNPTGSVIFFEVQGAVQACSTHTAPTSSAVFPGISQRLTVSMSGNFYTGQAAYIRYQTGGGWAGATIAQLTYAGTGSDYYFDIPANLNTVGATITYYFFTSGSGLSISNADADLYTINLLNNSGSNYSYQVNGTWQANTNGNWNIAGTWNTNQVPALAQNMGAVTINANVTLNQDANVSSLTINAAKSLVSESGQARTLTITSGGTLTNNGTYTANDGKVSFAGSGTVSGTIGFNNVDIAGSVRFGVSSTVNGTLKILAGGFVNIDAPTYATGSLLQYSINGSFNRDVEWSQTTGSAYPYNVQISNNTYLYMNNYGINQVRQIAGNLTIDQGSTFDMQGLTNGSADIGVTVLGNIVNNGTVNLSTTTERLKCTNYTNGAVTNTTATTTLSSIAGGDLELTGNLTDYGVFTPNQRAVFFTGSTGNQTITAPNGETFDYVIVDKAAGDIVLSNDIAINQKLTLTKGNIVIGAHNLTFGASAPAVAGAPSAINMIVADGTGTVRKVFTGNGSFDFPIGDATGTAEYSPISLNFSSGTYSNAYAAVRVTDAKHPNNTSATNYLTRYWTLTGSGISAFSCSVTGTFLPADISGSTASMVTAKWNGALPWVKYDAVGASTISASGITGFSDFTGISSVMPTVTIANNPALPVCQNAALTLTANPVGNPTFTYLWSNTATTQFISPPTSTVGSATYTVTVTDGNGFTASNSITAVVGDVQPPTASCQNITVDLDATGNATITPAMVNNGSTDNCSIASMSVNPSAFTCSNVSAGFTDLIISEYVKGSANNKYIEIFNGTPSTINLTGYELRNYSNGSSTPTYTNALSGSLSPGATAVYKNTSAAIYGGLATVLTSVAFNGNDAMVLYKIATASFVDIFGVIGNNPGTEWTGPGGYTTLGKTLRRKTTITKGVTTNPTGTGPTAFTTLTSEWDLFPIDNIAGLGAHTPIIVANAVTLTVTDASGNTANCISNVTVHDVTLPIASCKNITVLLDASGNVTITADQIDNGSTDNCGIQSKTVTPNTFNCSKIGANTVTLTVTDVNGNASTCTATVTVQDNTPPTASCKPATVQLNASGTVTIIPSLVNNGSSDLCGTPSLIVTPNTFTCANVGANTVTLTVTDASSNSSTCTATVTVQDVTAPTALCQNITAQLNATGTATITAAQINNGCSDICGIATLAVSPNSFTCADLTALSVFSDLIISEYVEGTSNNRAIEIYNGTGASVNLATYSLKKQNNGVGSFASELVLSGTIANNSTYVIANSGGSSPLLALANLSTGSACITFTGNDAVALYKSGVQIDVVGVVNQAANWGADMTLVRKSSITSPTTTYNQATDWTQYSTDDFSHLGSHTASSGGVRPVTLTVTDVNGNISICNATVTLQDIIAPNIVCPATPSAICSSGSHTHTGTAWDATATDNCSIATIAYTLTGATIATGSTTLNGQVFNVGITTVTWKATDVNGNFTICSFNVTVNALPTATITPGGPTTFCQGGSVTLTASTGTGYVYTWSTGATTQAITAIAAGSYTVTVTNANSCSAVSAVTTVTVNTLPTAIITPSGPTTFCQGGSVALTASAGTGYVYTWSNGATTRAITAISAGSYAVTVTNASGCTATSATTVIVNPLPTLVTASASSNTVCSGIPFNLFSSSNSNSSISNTYLSPTGDGGFETGTSFGANGWFEVNAASNYWILSNLAPAYFGSRGAHISQNGTAYNYDLTNAFTSHIYKEIAIPAGYQNISLSFYWKGKGEIGWDRLLIYTAPTTVTPVANTPASNTTAITGATLVWSQTALTTSYSIQTVSLPNSLAGSTFRLIFTWQNDAADGISPPIAVDNISITADLNQACTYSWTSVPSGFVSSSQNPAGVTQTATTQYIVTAQNSYGCTATNNVTVNIASSLSAAATANPATPICSGTSATLTASGSGGIAPYSYSWKVAGTEVSTSQSFSVTPATNTTYNLTITDICAQTATASVAVAVKQTPTAIASFNSPVCVGATLSLIGSTNNAGSTFIWSGPNGFTSSLQNPSISGVTATESGIYNFTATANGCTSAVSALPVTVNPTPATVMVTPASSSICIGNIQQLVASGGGLSPTILSQNFNSATNNWTLSNNSTGGTNPEYAAWSLRGNGYSYSYFGAWHSNDNTQFYLSNSSAQGFGNSSTTATILKSPPFSTTGYSAAILSFYHYYKSGNGGSAAVDISTDGTSWTNLLYYTYDWGLIAPFANTTISLPASFLNQPTVYIRFKYDANWQYFWGIDNVSITGTPNSVPITWSPTTNLFTDPAATLPYAGTGLTVYAKPSSTTTYTATATSTTGCTNSGSSFITVNPLPTAVITPSNPPIICPGTSVVLTASEVGGTGISYAWNTGAIITTVTALSTGTYIVTVTDGNGCKDTESASVTVADNVVPTFTMPNLSTGYCVEGFDAAVYKPGGIYYVDDLTPIRRDYHILTTGNTLLDLTNITDNCPGTITIAWSIDFANNGSVDLTGTGQISASTPIDFPLGDNKITWIVTDANGQHATDFRILNVLPRPNIQD